MDSLKTNAAEYRHLKDDSSNVQLTGPYPQENLHFSMDAMPKYKEMLTDEYYQSCVPLTCENLFEQMDKCLHLEQPQEPNVTRLMDMRIANHQRPKKQRCFSRNDENQP